MSKWKKNTRHSLALLLTLLLFLGGAPLTALPAHASVVIPAGYTAIRTAADLDAMRGNLAGNYYLDNDLNMTAWGNWTPVGQPVAPFTGVFDGNGFAVSGLAVTLIGTDAAGLFGRVEGGEIRNLTLLDCDIKGLDMTGGIAGSAVNSVIRNCVVTGSVGGSAARAGGIAGDASLSEITDCRNEADITAADFAGGIVGAMDNTTLEFSSNAGKISGLNISAAQSIGGIAECRWVYSKLQERWGYKCG